MLNKKIRWKELIISLVIPLAVGGLSTLITKDAMEDFQALHQPLLSPSAWVFPVVWTILYLMMGLASYQIVTAGVSEPRRRRALIFYGLQLAANFLWTIVFFSLRIYLTAFLWILVLWLLIFVCTVLFYYIRRSAGKLMVPYILWVTFAAYLNLGIYLLN